MSHLSAHKPNAHVSEGEGETLSILNNLLFAVP
jgi:hypothetical protein